MNLSGWQNGRRLIPRWRSYAATLKSRELGSPTGKLIAAVVPPEFLSSLETFGLAPGLVTAAEAVQSAIVNGQEHLAINAARRIVNIDADAAPLIREQAIALLRRVGRDEDIPEDGRRIEGPERSVKLAAGGWRRMSQVNPLDPIAWVELSLAQTILGHRRAAMKSMTIALNLAPHNRHVLRSASRLYLHASDHQRAHDTIAANLATKKDPWLMAAEIALAEIAERSPTYLKQGLATIDGAGLRPHQITELAGAIGTVDLLEGNRKRSRRLFSKSMTDPNGNALAQGEWAAASLGAEIIPSMSLSTVPEAGEAKALHLYRGSRFQQAVGVCEEWMESDPFSLRPYEFASTAAGLVEDYENALSFANRGMELRLSAPLLLGAAFALASTGRLEEAAAKLDLVDESEGDRIPYVVSANRGLIAFRRGEPSEGRRLYMEAIEGFKKINVPALSAKARVYLAREALLANEPDADALLSLAKSAVATSGGFEANAVLAIIEQRRGGGGGEPKSDRPEALSKKPLDPRDISWTAPGLATPYRNDLPDNRPPASSRPKGNNR